MEDGLPPISTFGATDIVIDNSNPDITYTAFWGEGIFKTTNANASQPKWKKLFTGLPSGNFKRISMGISKSEPNRIYALMDNDSDVIDQFYQSHDNGETWERITIDVPPGRRNGPNDLGVQGFYDINVAVHPRDANIVYLSGISLWKAIRDKNTNNWRFSDIGLELHPDNHSFAFDSKNPEILYAGNDGGIYKSSDGGKTWDDNINQGLCITQFDFMEQHPISEKIIFAGAQDNGTLRYEGTPTFDLVDDGDGGFVCIDPKDPNNVWHTYANLTLAFSEQGGKYQSFADLSDKISGQISNFYPPLALDKTDTNNIAIGGRMLYLDDSKGKNGFKERVDLHFADNDLISAINYVNSNLIYVGTNFGRIYRLTGKSDNRKVQSINADPFPRRYIWDMSILPSDDTKLVVVVSGFFTGDNVGHVYRGSLPSNGGEATWTDISGTGTDGRLPDIPVNALVIDDDKPDTIYIGTDVGVFRTVDGGRNWILFNKGLPNCQVYDMRLHSRTGLLRIATHGRGIWQRQVR